MNQNQNLVTEKELQLKRNITYLTNACLITCIVEMGSAEKVLEAAKNSGAQGAPEIMQDI